MSESSTRRGRAYRSRAQGIGVCEGEDGSIPSSALPGLLTDRADEYIEILIAAGVAPSTITMEFSEPVPGAAGAIFSAIVRYMNDSKVPYPPADA